MINKLPLYQNKHYTICKILPYTLFVEIPNNSTDKPN